MSVYHHALKVVEGPMMALEFPVIGPDHQDLPRSGEHATPLITEVFDPCVPSLTAEALVHVFTSTVPT